MHLFTLSDSESDTLEITLRRLLLVVSVTLLAIFSMPQAKADAAPNFNFTDPFTDQATSINGLSGRVVYLDFWASWCVPCRQSFPFMNELHDRYGDKGLVILAVNVDAKRADADRFLAQFPADFRVLYDPNAALPPVYQVMGMPTAYLIDHRGNIAETSVGFRLDERQQTEEKLVELLRAAGRL
ncbi:TlpA family protein disulfide reductase [Saccharospirillum mangrovi]|uniref:TlpA family protein disulfide reductase n=1 Tax=Saccharospirillum mangrovi TaxID=2161747 RepID=UPI0013004052|nr:TlpA disulfide reductase family protein [Saccharospirillum mangrovi]